VFFWIVLAQKKYPKPPAGMALLRGSRLTVDAAPDGPVLIAEFP
jgi:hypothetical protein